MSVRLDQHYQIDTTLSLMSDVALRAQLARASFNEGWGNTGTMRLGKHSVFVKKVPLTDLEMANFFCTRNLYRIPGWYSYGIGSAGFGAFRELAAHRKSTNWVLSGEASTFPLLHHHRILPIEKPVTPIKDLDRYVTYWNGSQTVRRYMVDRAAANFELVLFLEQLTPFRDWIVNNPMKLPRMVQSALKNVEVMRANGMIHFDAHADNWLTDGRQVYFTDFGLVLDQDFELSSAERAFMKQHQNYDYAQVIATVGDAAAYQYLQLGQPAQRRIEALLGVSATDFYRFVHALIRNATRLHELKLMPSPKHFRAHVDRYLPIIEAKNEFFLTLRESKKRTDQYPSRKLNRLMNAAGVFG